MREESLHFLKKLQIFVTKYPGGSDGTENPRKFLGDLLDHWACCSLHLLRESSSGQQTRVVLVRRANVQGSQSYLGQEPLLD